MAIILVIEDQPTNRKLVRDILRRAGHQVEEAADASEGLLEARRLLPSLIIMDIQLPGMDGLSATKILKSDPLTGDIPVLALTAHALPGDGDRFLDGGCDAYLSKPVSYSKLLEKVSLLLGQETSA